MTINILIAWDSKVSYFSSPLIKIIAIREIKEIRNIFAKQLQLTSYLLLGPIYAKFQIYAKTIQFIVLKRQIVQQYTTSRAIKLKIYPTGSLFKNHSNRAAQEYLLKYENVRETIKSTIFSNPTRLIKSKWLQVLYFSMKKYYWI